MDFPTTSWGDRTIPGGSYASLRICSSSGTRVCRSSADATETIASAVWFFSGGVLTYARYFGLKLGARGMRVTKRATAAEMATLRGLKDEITAKG